MYCVLKMSLGYPSLSPLQGQYQLRLRQGFINRGSRGMFYWKKIFFISLKLKTLHDFNRSRRSIFNEVIWSTNMVGILEIHCNLEGATTSAGTVMTCMIPCIPTNSPPPPPDKIAAISQTIFSDEFSWMKIFCFDKISLKSLLKGLMNNPLSIGLRNGLAPNRQLVIIWTNADRIHWRIYAVLWREELKIRGVIFGDVFNLDFSSSLPVVCAVVLKLLVMKAEYYRINTPPI